MSSGPTAGTLLAASLLVVLAATVTVPAGGQAGATTLADLGQIDADTVLLDVSLQPDGDADWSLRYRVRLDDDNETAAFESLERDVEANRSAFASRFADRMERTVRAAENATGRDMAVRNVTVRTTRQEIPQRYGVLVYEFEWAGFATANGSAIRAGDAIGGLFLDDSTSLTVHWPAGYGLASADPSPDDTGSQSATWRGPQDFSTDQPRLAVSTDAAAGDGPDGDDGPGPGDTSGGLSPVSLALAGIVAMVVVVGATLWWRGRRPGESGPPAPGPAQPDAPEELLSNEERVLRLLEQRGGRMKQQQVVEELGWTDAKTSQVVGELREAGKVEAFRLGRENVLDLPTDEEDGDGEP